MRYIIGVSLKYFGTVSWTLATDISQTPQRFTLTALVDQKPKLTCATVSHLAGFNTRFYLTIKHTVKRYRITVTVPLLYSN